MLAQASGIGLNKLTSTLEARETLENAPKTAPTAGTPSRRRRRRGAAARHGAQGQPGQRELPRGLHGRRVAARPEGLADPRLGQQAFREAGRHLWLMQKWENAWENA